MPESKFQRPWLKTVLFWFPNKTDIARFLHDNHTSSVLSVRPFAIEIMEDKLVRSHLTTSTCHRKISHFHHFGNFPLLSVKQSYFQHNFHFIGGRVWTLVSFFCPFSPNGDFQSIYLVLMDWFKMFKTNHLNGLQKLITLWPRQSSYMSFASSTD